MKGSPPAKGWWVQQRLIEQENDGSGRWRIAAENPFGPYRLVRYIKAGGFGKVYEATHPQQGQVALSLPFNQQQWTGLQKEAGERRAILGFWMITPSI